MRKFILATVALLTTSPALTHDWHPQRTIAVVHPCGRFDSTDNLVEPVRTFANGAIKVAHVSTGEPASWSDHLFIFIGADCFAISRNTVSGYLGFYSLSVTDIDASYDDRTGLLLRVPVSVADDGIERSAGDINVLINRTHGTSVIILR